MSQVKSKKNYKTVISFIPKYIIQNKKSNDYFDAIVLCADISGFTAMSEKLALSGKEGAEEISLIINLFFRQLIDIINKNGGDIFYFSGDAITAIFDKQNNVNALISALEVIEFVKKNKKVKTTQGTFNISIHIGLTMGKVFFADSKISFNFSKMCKDF